MLARTVAFYLASPSNPQGAVADLAYLARVTELARRHGFLVFCDECYSEIYTTTQPAGILQAAGDNFENVVLFQSLSKRSNLPGLRIGFAAGDRRFLAEFLELRSVAAPQVPIPAQHVAIAAYDDEAHVEDNRDLYRLKFDLADQIIGDRYGYQRPAGGFFLWLDVVGARRQRGGGREAVARRRRAGAARPLLRARAGSTAAIPARTTSASPWCTTRRPRPRRFTASSPCSASACPASGSVGHAQGDVGASAWRSRPFIAASTPARSCRTI